MSAQVNAAVSATAASAQGVSDAISDYVASIAAGKTNVVRVVSLKVVAAVQKATPVDTGRARAGWNAGVRAVGGNPTVSRRKSVTALGVALGNTEGRGTLTVTEKRTEFVAQNGVRYTPFLEAGASPQAPYGFVRRILDDHADDLIEATKRIKTEGTK